ncbi:MAG: MFS transporter [Xanthobacteraceae bacterium]|nr:MFS transporter [Xanthobacteraceae bacterium]
MNHHPHAILAPARSARRARRKSVVLLTLCLGVLVAQVDTSVVNLAMQPIGSAFGASVTQLQWVLDAYNLVYATLLLTGGLVADLYGRRLAFQLGAAVLLIASLGCAFAPSVDFLIAGRAVAGLGSALLLPASLAIVRVVFTDQAERRRALGVWASCNGLAFVIGPTLGGFCIAWFGWPSVFLLVVPLALAAFVLATMIVPESSDPADRHEDFPGQILGAIVLGGLVYVGIAGLGGDGASLLALLLSAIAFPLFLLVEDRAQASALVPLDLFQNRSFCGAIVATASMTFGVYGVIFLVPLVWQSSGFLFPQTAGLALVPCALAFFLIAPRSGHMAQHVGVRVMTAGGTAVIACGLLVLAATQGGRPFMVAQIGLVLAGIGMGLNTGPLMSVAVDAVSAARSGTASALINVARMTGAALGVAFLGTAFAMWHGGAEGLRTAMLIGAAVQFGGAMVAWVTIW